MMTAHRFKQLLAGAKPNNQQEVDEFQRQLRAQSRREAARRAVETKRKKYGAWPTRGWKNPK